MYIDTQEWLFNDVRPFWADVTNVTTDASVDRKEPAMATKSAKTATTTKKETTPMTKEEKKAAALAKTRAEIDELKKKYDAPAIEDPINVHNILRAEFTGKPAVGLYVSDLDKELLCWKANEFGWTTNGFMTKNQVETCHGTIPEGAHSIVLHSPTGFPATYYNVDEIEWESDEGPVYDDGIKKQQDRNRREKAAAKKANIQMLGLPNGVTMPVNINDKRAMKAYLAACEAIKAAMVA